VVYPSIQNKNPKEKKVMKSFRSELVVLILSAIILGGCGGKKSQDADDEFPADIMTNPGAASGQGTAKTARITFVKEEHDFGTIKDGEKVYWNFRFKNTGNTDLILNRVKADCGCTAPEYPKNPIAPGEEGKIKVTFDSKGRPGMNVKKVTILSNSERPTNVLTIKALVEK
jgi:hypothetical protein